MQDEKAQSRTVADIIPDDTAQYLFHQGTNFRAYDFLGCHILKDGEETAFTFRVWAPNADAVALTGDICGWENELPMNRETDMGLWSLTVKTDKPLENTFYKYKITNGGISYLKADPYAVKNETLKKTASVIYDISGYEWHDNGWYDYKRTMFVAKTGRKTNQKQHYWSAPMNIYEVHLGSWRTKDGNTTENGDNYLNYREIADLLAPYVKKMGYTHVELMPVMEHPFDGSWGYQICGYYSPTTRFGDPEDFKYFIDKLHSCGIGVILDWVPAHFPKDRHGLFEFDGQPLYEYQGADRMEHSGWGTRFFDVGRNEVQSFLISNAMFWLREYHADGLRIDAVAAMLYLDYDREPGKWIPNLNGGNQNLEAIAFFKKLNTAVFAEFPETLMIAEESTSWADITKPVSEGGLGFNFKWNMGWSNDMFEYIATDPIYRKYCHEKLTFPMMYAFTENFILPVSHDEVVHGKKSLLDKNFGPYDNKFAGDRVCMAYQMTLPGKKLMFMGGEFGQFREWDFANQLEWFMLDYPRHSELQHYVSDLNSFYLSEPALWEIDDSWDGFEWIEADQREKNVISYRRIDKNGKDLIIILNFAPVKRIDYCVRVPKKGRYAEIFNSDLYEYGGLNITNTEDAISSLNNADNKYYIKVTLPGLSALVFKYKPKAGRANNPEK